MDPSATEKSWAWLGRTLRSTKWSLVRRLRRSAPGDGGRPAEEFCRCYWYPLYAFLRHAGYSQADAQDHVQSFLVRLLKQNLLASAEPERGRLRNFLITLLTRHIAARKERGHAQKRGGGALHVPLEWEAAEASFLQQGLTAGSPEEAFRRALATRLVAEGIAALRKHYSDAGRLQLCEELLPALEGTLPDSTYAEVADRLGMRPGAVRTAALRMRERFRLCVKQSASALLGIPDGPRLDEELRELFCTSFLPATM